MDILATPQRLRLVAILFASTLLGTALAAPQTTLLLLPLAVGAVGALLAYEVPAFSCAVLIMTFGLGVDVHISLLTHAAGPSGPEGESSLGSAIAKVVPFAVAGVLILRYGVARAINWPFFAFTLVAGISIAVLPMGHISSNTEMVRSFVGSTAPFALAFALAPRAVWTVLCRGVVLVPILSTLGGMLTHIAGIYPAFDDRGRFQGLHSPPFLAGFCTTAIFAATLEYLRGFRMRWLILGGLDLAILLTTQARTPTAVVGIFLLLVFFASGRDVFPLKRKVDLVMGGLVPGTIVIGPAIAYALERFVSQGDSLSGRDILWSYFTDAIAQRPLLGYGLGAGKLVVNPYDQVIKYIGSVAPHNEYLRLTVEGGVIGCAMIFLAILLWIWVGTRDTPPAERLVMRAAILGVLFHSAFDNTLIATTGVIQFIWFSAALARGRMEMPARGSYGAHYAASRGRAMSSAGAKAISQASRA
ncbi:MAG TPA: O-antigen ligase family protein [Crenalkalicoccus sp.]|jgi:O-antigen ligase|nr:O-antigen ligase family protein [Crenalkalicoccus sp.]